MKIDAFPNRAPYDLVVFSHLRWDFVYQRPQHLLSRFARDRRVFFFEEPVLGADSARLEVRDGPGQLKIIVPHVPMHNFHDTFIIQEQLILEFLLGNMISDYDCWYYTAMALNFTKSLNPFV